jgi:hypothetical protein
MSDPILSLSTELDPPSVFEVDGEQYQLLGLTHLSDEQESKATAMFSRFGQLTYKMETAPTDKEAEKLSKDLRKRRLDIIAFLTTMPRDVVEKLPLPGQIQLFQAVRRETNAESDDGGEEG